MAKEVVIPWELKYKYAMGGWTTNHKGWLYEIREKYGAAAAREMYETLCNRNDRVKNMTNTLLNVFNIEGNDAETMAKWWTVWWELNGGEYTILEQTKTFTRNKLTKGPWTTAYKDISDWALNFTKIVVKTINPKATAERLKGMCVGDSHCEYAYKIKE